MTPRHRQMKISRLLLLRENSKINKNSSMSWWRSNLISSLQSAKLCRLRDRSLESLRQCRHTKRKWQLMLTYWLWETQFSTQHRSKLNKTREKNFKFLKKAPHLKIWTLKEVCTNTQIQSSVLPERPKSHLLKKYINTRVELPTNRKPRGSRDRSASTNGPRSRQFKSKRQRESILTTYLSMTITKSAGIWNIL